MIYNKKGFTVQGWLVSLIIFVVGVSLFGLFATSLSTDQGISIDQGYYSNISSNMDTLYLQSQNIKETTQGAGAGTEDSESNFLGGLLSAVKLSFSSLDTTHGIVSESASVFRLPSLVVGAIITVLIILVTFAIISAFVKKDV